MTALSEEVRLGALAETGLLDSEPESEFDDLVALAAEVCSTPISLFSLVDRDRQWFKAVVGLDVRETGRDVSFCSHAIASGGILEVEDARKDDRFEDNELVTGKPEIRFYAGVPVVGPGGLALGTLCVIDVVPRRLTGQQRAALQILAAQVESRLVLREQQRMLEEALRQKETLLAELHAKETLFRRFMDAGPFVSFIKDRDGRMQYYNQPLAKQFGVSPTEWIGKLDHELWPQEQADEFRRNDLAVMAADRGVEVDEETIDADGQRTCWRSYKFTWINEHGAAMLGGVAVDVTKHIERKRALQVANTKLEALATIDPLTGLRNRRELDLSLEDKFRRARVTNGALSVILIDLDNFKRANDRLGHAGGDAILRFTGDVLQKLAVGPDDVAARLGGEEFVVILPGAGTEEARALAEEMRQALREGSSPAHTVTVSVGIASIDPTATTATRLLNRADEAMYAAKRAGKDRVVTHRQMLAEAMVLARGDAHARSGIRALAMQT